MKTRFPMIAAVAMIATPFAAQASTSAEQELDPARLSELVCQFGGDCGEPVVEEAAFDPDAQVVVGVRAGNATRPATPFPDFKTLQALKKTGKGGATASAPVASRPNREVARAARSELKAPVVGRRGSSAGAVEVAEAVAKRANLFVTFRLGSAELEASAVKEINAVAEAIRVTSAAGKVKKVRIAGHTDATGDDEVNNKLSADRAAAVRQALLDRGIPAEMLEAQGFGSTQPIDGYEATNGINRRVEAVVIE
jgi:OmpA-OmpF porin, OOP family